MRGLYQNDLNICTMVHTVLFFFFFFFFAKRGDVSSSINNSIRV